MRMTRRITTAVSLLLLGSGLAACATVGRTAGQVPEPSRVVTAGTPPTTPVSPPVSGASAPPPPGAAGLPAPGSSGIVVTGTVTASPSCPGPQRPDSPCPNRPVIGAPVELAANGKVVATTTTDATGHFRFSVPAGTYDITARNVGYASRTTRTVTVTAPVDVPLVVDSGIR